MFELQLSITRALFHGKAQRMAQINPMTWTGLQNHLWIHRPDSYFLWLRQKTLFAFYRRAGLLR